MVTIMRLGWGADDPAFCQLFTSRMMPGASKEEADAFNELQRRTTSAEMAARYFATVGDFDINDLLAKVTVPTLVMHARGDLMQPFEKGRRIASAILGARFVALQSNNHMFCLSMVERNSCIAEIACHGTISRLPAAGEIGIFRVCWEW
jgi:pimeloyl-ACP methyl ester carboxylesterase